MFRIFNKNIYVTYQMLIQAFDDEVLSKPNVLKSAVSLLKTTCVRVGHHITILQKTLTGFMKLIFQDIR